MKKTFLRHILSGVCKSKLKSMAIILPFILITFTIFRTIQTNDSKQLMSAISTILRNESMASNPYQLSKSIADIETLGLLDCVILKEVDGSIFYDTSSSPNCSIGKWMAPFRTNTAELTSINGVNFILKIQPKTDFSKLMLEILAYIIIIATFIQIKMSIDRNSQLSEARVKAIEIEKQMVLDHNRQIRHDVASPLTAINTIVRLIPKMDPELKSVLLLATERTQSLFNELSKPTQNPDETSSKKELPKVEVSSSIDEVISEKKSVWGHLVEIIYVNSMDNSQTAIADKSVLSRILSNVLNNSFEALDSSKEPKVLVEARETSTCICIEISDNGKGIPTEMIHRIGEKGFSIGKEGHATAGSGLGIYGAIQSLKEWDGDLKISSINGSGTSVTILLKKALTI